MNNKNFREHIQIATVKTAHVKLEKLNLSNPQKVFSYIDSISDFHDEETDEPILQTIPFMIDDKLKSLETAQDDTIYNDVKEILKGVLNLIETDNITELRFSYDS